MSLFHYPKSKLQRKLKPRKFKRYQSYQRFLKNEFGRFCSYCRQPDTSAPNLNFGVDHYRPKGIPRFAHLVNEYSNLYYCCGNCNSRKTNYWPVNEKTDPMIVSPCEFTMAEHMRFNSSTFKIEAKSNSIHGQHTIDLLQLNLPELVAYRKSCIFIVKGLESLIDSLEEEAKQYDDALRNMRISDAEYHEAIGEIAEELATARSTLQAQTGDIPPLPVKTTKLGISLIGN